MNRALVWFCWLSAAAALAIGSIWIGVYVAGLDPGDSLYEESIGFAALFIGGGAIVLAMSLVGGAVFLSPNADRTRTGYFAALGVVALLLGVVLGPRGIIGFGALAGAAGCFYLTRRRLSNRYGRVAATGGVVLAGALLVLLLAVPR
jgi:hypothetical protein